LFSTYKEFACMIIIKGYITDKYSFVTIPLAVIAEHFFVFWLFEL
jgi:hypothetical protein